MDVEVALSLEFNYLLCQWHLDCLELAGLLWYRNSTGFWFYSFHFHLYVCFNVAVTAFEGGFTEHLQTLQQL